MPRTDQRVSPGDAEKAGATARQMLKRVCWIDAKGALPTHIEELEACGRRLRGLGFDAVLLVMPRIQEPASVPDVLAQTLKACLDTGLALIADLTLALPREGTQTDWTAHLEQVQTGVIDPRRSDADIPWRLRRESEDIRELVDTWAQALSMWAEQGLAGVRCRWLQAFTAGQWAQLIAQVHSRHPDFRFIAWTPGQTPDQLQSLENCGFDISILSLPWWDGISSWLLQERQRLARVGELYAPLNDPATRTGDLNATRLWLAAFFSAGIIVPWDAIEVIGADTVKEVNAWIARNQGSTAPDGADEIRTLTGPLATLVAYARTRPSACTLVLNADQHRPRSVDAALLAARLPGEYVLQTEDAQALPRSVAPGGLFIASLARAGCVRTSARHSRSASDAAMRGPRVAIERIIPSVGEGEFSARSCVGDAVSVSADVFSDGHDVIAANLLWKPADEKVWAGVPMKPLGNDRWEASFQPDRIGAHVYCIQAWRDEWATHAEHLRKKLDAAQDVHLEVDEALEMIELAAGRLAQTAAQAGTRLSSLHSQASGVLRRDGITYDGASTRQACELLLSPELTSLMAMADEHAFESQSQVMPLTVDRRAGRFASWYELFPRSQSPEAGRHGTLRDVIGRLPAISRMGFDVLYFPPIHPIGTASRKGRNNALRAEPGDPGSPYAIGAETGGHDAIHPELGTLEDFGALVRAANDHGLEIALDFAIQCSPDHPWLKEHPDWFDWRADGTLRHAENPPKRYEDIVNPSFYDPQGLPRMPLWHALRDIILFWAGQGVYTFRVDNPHTKPLPFWQWLIAQVKARHPQCLFLSEAFTRPAMMQRLAKVGFSQSYTYFTWRNSRQELTDYLNELNTRPTADYFRPNFFVNTPDINPYFLQDGGRAAFLIRAALAATLSGLWGMYSGFELCEAAAVPGKEEYLDAEKYELRQRDWDSPNIIAQITQLNGLRRANPALQSHLGVRFHSLDNDRMIFYSKSTPQGDSIVLVVVSLDPHVPQRGTLQLPLWQWGLTEHDAVRLEDLLGASRFELMGASHTVSLSPEQPYLVWGLLPAGH